MARKTKLVEIAVDPENRDGGKIFKITEMAAAQAEDWAMRALGVMTRAGFSVSEASEGMAAISSAMLLSLLKGPIEDVRPLFDELLACATIETPTGFRKTLMSDFEEIATRVRLRDEVLELHLGFSLAAALQSVWRRRAQEPLPITPDPETPPA